MARIAIDDVFYSERCVASPIVPTHNLRVWEIITAWYCKPSEVTKLIRNR